MTAQAGAVPRFEGRLLLSRYRPMASRTWQLRIQEAGFASSYWSEERLLGGMVALLRG